MDTKITHETVENLFKELDLTHENLSFKLEKLMAVDARYIKDLKINVSNALGSKNLNKKEGYLLGFAVAVNENHQALQQPVPHRRFAHVTEE